VAPPARGNIIVQTLRDGSRVFKLRLRARGRREMEVVHERRDCSCGCGGGWNERAHLLARWLRRQHDCRRRPRRVSDVSRRTRSARPAAGIGAVIRNPRPLRGGRATQGIDWVLTARKRLRRLRLGSRQKRRNRLLAGGSRDGETRTRTGDTTIFSRAAVASETSQFAGNPWLLATCTASTFSRALRRFPRRYGRWRGSSAFSLVAMAILIAGGAAPHVGCPGLGHEVAVITL
jgi:hypothetical protein